MLPRSITASNAEYEPKLSYDRPLPNERLAVTSTLHPFWKTKNGLAIVALVVLVFIGAIVGGAIGGAQASKSNDDTNTTSKSAPSATPTTNSRVVSEVFGSGNLAPRINDDLSGQRTHGRAFFDPSPITANPTMITPSALFKVVA